MACVICTTLELTHSRRAGVKRLQINIANNIFTDMFHAFIISAEIKFIIKKGKAVMPYASQSTKVIFVLGTVCNINAKSYMFHNLHM